MITHVIMNDHHTKQEKNLSQELNNAKHEGMALIMEGLNIY